MLSTLRKIWFAFTHGNNKNIVIGSGLQLHCRLSIKGPGRVEIGENCHIEPLAGARIQMVTLYTHSPDAIISIGDNVLLVAAKISSKFSVSIGSNVIIEDASILDTDFHTLDVSRQPPPDEHLEQCRIVLEDDVQVGSRSIITKGVTIGRGSLIYPGTVVQKSFPAESVLYGNPAKKIRKK